ncbi:hypothetical protein Taro_002487 [Colocasia esculenta]|uniref:Uncharacterized protein n=1 Tax=Colocasia esculenta TaxID=4460 RepID=A0A843TLN4_COLES|nr:hypothetical protein [Colocasia esculenta]
MEATGVAIPVKAVHWLGGGDPDRAEAAREPIKGPQGPLLRGLAKMASHGRCNVQAREDEQRHEERGEQQAPAPQGPTVLPPPPLLDYGVFMQGLVEVMQTQAQTQAALWAQLQAQAQAPAPVP